LRPNEIIGRARVRKFLPQRSPRTQRRKSFLIWRKPGWSGGCLVDGNTSLWTLCSLWLWILLFHPTKPMQTNLLHSAPLRLFGRFLCCIPTPPIPGRVLGQTAAWKGRAEIRSILSAQTNHYFINFIRW